MEITAYIVIVLAIVTANYLIKAIDWLRIHGQSWIDRIRKIL